MNAWTIHEFGGRDRLTLEAMPDPEVGEGDVLIRVKAVGVNPVDWKIREGLLKDLFPHAFPVVLGWDVAGVVASVGYSARRFRPGDEVFAYARRPVIQHGTYAEMVVLPESYVARRPAGTSWEASAAMPLAGLTAYQMVFDAGAIGPGSRVLVLGASGGVGSFAVQLAKIAGADVIGLSSRSNHGYLKRLGADAVLDYMDPEYPEQLRRHIPGGVDVLLDCVGGDSLETGIGLVGSGGRLVTITDPESEARAAAAGIDFRFVFVEPNVPQLDALAAHVREGRLRIDVSRAFPFDDVPAAHEQMETGHTRGKIVLTL